MDIIKKTLTLGKVDGYGNGRRSCLVTLELEIRPIERAGRTIDLEPIPADSVCVSICGDVWNSSQTDLITCGQCVDTIAGFYPHSKTVRRICEIWRRWHLNDMKAGTRAQDEALDDMPGPYEYTKACAHLESKGIVVDRGYRYGTAWLTEPVPPEIVAELQSLFV